MNLHSESLHPTIFNVGILGNGPRGAALNMHAIAAALAESCRFDLLHSLGQPFKVHFHTFEQKPWSERAVGRAFSPSCHGMINTHVPGPEDAIIPRVDSTNPKHLRIIHHVRDIRGQLQAYLQDNWKSTMAEYRRVNTAAAASLEHATQSDGTVDVTVPCSTRGTLGTVMQEQFDTVMDQGPREIPWMEFHFYYDTAVVACDATSDCLRPTFTTKCLKTNAKVMRVFDHVVLAEGILSQDPVEESLKKRTYMGQPNLDHVLAFFDSLGLLGDDGYLHPEARVLILGMSLSAIDMATIGAQATGLVTASKAGPSPFDWDTDRLQKYIGTFTNMSRCNTPYVAPRHTHGAQWLGSTPFPLSRLMIRSALIDKNGNALSKLQPIVYAAAARAMSRVPVNNPLRLATVSDFQAELFSQNEDYFQNRNLQGEGGATWSAFLRAGIVSIVNGSGITHCNSSISGGKTEENDDFRQLIAQRDGWVAFRAMALLHSEDTELGPCSDPDFLRHWKTEVYPYAGASPVCVAHCFASMFQHNITSHIQSSFDSIGLCPKTGKVTCEGRQFDCILGSPMLPIHGTNHHIQPLPRRVKETLPQKPAFAKGRLYQTPDGETCGVTELGMIGHGIADKTPNGDSILRDADWIDTHNYSSAVQLAPIVVRYIFCKAALQANGFSDAATCIDNLCRATWIPDAKYAEVMASLAEAHSELYATAAYCDFCTNYSGGDPVKFADAFDQIGSVSSQDTFASRCGKDGAETAASAAAATYFEAVRSIPPFRPKTREEYYSDWIDFTPNEIQQVWDRICDDLIRKSGGSCL